MSRLGKIAFALVSVVAVAALGVALVAVGHDRSTQRSLDATKQKLSAVSSAQTAPARGPSLEAMRGELASQDGEISIIQADVARIQRTDACKAPAVSAYFNQLEGATEAGSDESAAFGLLDAICPNVS
jgi:hypothetical protein